MMAKRVRQPPSSLDKRDLKAIALIRASGVLSKDAKLDEVIKLSERLGAEAQARGHIFIFRNVVLSKCPF